MPTLQADKLRRVLLTSRVFPAQSRHPRDIVRLKSLLKRDDFDQHVLPRNGVRHSEPRKLLRRDRDGVSQHVVSEFSHLVRLPVSLDEILAEAPIAIK